ncbi:MAG: hypothetical protein KGM91_21615, partial [Burkholderiales bacterium]|nr:hypothetical protein [Burkholderiales bacterium]
MTDDELDTIKRFFATHNANRHLALYQREPDVRLLEKAQREYLALDLMPPDALHARFAELGRAIEADSPQSAYRRVLGLRLSRLELARMQRRRDVVEAYAGFMSLPDKPISANKALRNIAAAHGMTVGNVKRIVSQWGGMVRQESMRRRGRVPTAPGTQQLLSTWWQ